MTGHSSLITSEKVTAGLMNLHPFNQLNDGTEFRTGGGQDDKKDQNPGAGSGTGPRATNRRQRAAAASPRRRKGRTRSASGGTAHGGTARHTGSADGCTAAHGGTARRTGSADGCTAAHGHPARRTGTTHGDATFRAPAVGRTTSSPGGNQSQFSGGDQPRGTTTTAPGVPSATCLAPAGSAGRPGAHQPAGPITAAAQYASTATR